MLCALWGRRYIGAHFIFSFRIYPVFHYVLDVIVSLDVVSCFSLFLVRALFLCLSLLSSLGRSLKFELCARYKNGRRGEGLAGKTPSVAGVSPNSKSTGPEISGAMVDRVPFIQADVVEMRVFPFRMSCPFVSMHHGDGLRFICLSVLNSGGKFA